MNPYEVLGINNNASQDEIKEKYRVLLEEYTMNQDETTEEKIQKLNDAYDMLVNGNLYREIRGLIERKNFAAAEARLNIANDRDNGEWNYLQSFVCVQKGWFETGLNYLRKAVELDPENSKIILKKVEMVFGRTMKLSEITEDQVDLFNLVVMDMRDLAAEN